MSRVITEETRKKISKSHIGKPGTNLGKKFTLEWKNNISKSLKGKHCSPRTEFKKGHKQSEESNRKNSEAHLGERSPCWQGGKSFEPYTVDWTETLKRSIRERDHYTCQVCGLVQTDKAFSVHHIDYNKENCNPNNLITLCTNCHMKTNFNRNKWMEFFKNKSTVRGSQ